MARRQLTRTYDNWVDLARDLYADVLESGEFTTLDLVQGLRQANPDVSSFYRGMTLEIPSTQTGATSGRPNDPSLIGWPTPAPPEEEEEQQPPPQPNIPTGVPRPNDPGLINWPTPTPPPTPRPQPPRPEEVPAEPPARTGTQLGGEPAQTQFAPALTASPWEETSAAMRDLDIYSFFYGPQYSEQAVEEFYRPPSSFETPTRDRQRYDVQAIQSQRGVDVTPREPEPPAFISQPIARPAWLNRLIGRVRSYTTPAVGVPGGQPGAAQAVRDYTARQARADARQRVAQQAPGLEGILDEPIIPLIGRAAPDDYDWLSDWIIAQGADPNDPQSLNELFSRVDDITGYMLRMVGIAELAEEPAAREEVLPPRFGQPGFVDGYRYTYPQYPYPSYNYTFPTFGGGGGGARPEFRRDRRPGFMPAVVWRI